MAKAILIAVNTETDHVQAWTRAGFRPLNDPFFKAEVMEEHTARVTRAKLMDTDLANAAVLRVTGQALLYHVIELMTPMTERNV